jgi:hypothetical protein
MADVLTPPPRRMVFAIFTGRPCRGDGDSPGERAWSFVPFVFWQDMEREFRRLTGRADYCDDRFVRGIVACPDDPTVRTDWGPDPDRFVAAAGARLSAWERAARPPLTQAQRRSDRIADEWADCDIL